MNKIKFKGKYCDLLGEVILKDKELNIKAVDKNQTIKHISDFGAKIKVISSFPKLNTSVCDDQTKEIAKLANKYKDISFISITMDSVKTIEKWCLVHYLENIDILSDQKHGEFGKATKLLIKSLKMLARGFIILDKHNKVIDYFYKEEITESPNFQALEKALKIHA